MATLSRRKSTVGWGVAEFKISMNIHKIYNIQLSASLLGSNKFDK
jgi:hypothetical protein